MSRVPSSSMPPHPPPPLPKCRECPCLRPDVWFPGAALRTTGRSREGGQTEQRDGMKEGLGLSQPASRTEKRKGSWPDRQLRSPAGRPSGKGTLAPTRAGRAGDPAELRCHPRPRRRRRRDHREPCLVGSLHELDLGKPSASSLRGAADDCVRPPGRPETRPRIPAVT